MWNYFFENIAVHVLKFQLKLWFGIIEFNTNDSNKPCFSSLSLFQVVLF